MSAAASKRVRSPAKAGRTLRAWWIVVGLAALVFVVYADVRHFPFVNFDDADYVSANAPVAGGLSWASVAWAFTTFHAANWIPLTWLSFMTDVSLNGVDPGALHVTNVVLHAASTLLLFGCLYRLTGAAGRSAFVAGAFAVHPLHVESVAWITERKDALSGVCWWLTVWTYISYTRRPDWIRYAIVMAAYALALLAKSMVVTLPFVLLLIDYWPLERVRSLTDWQRLLVLGREKIPLLAMAAATAVVTYAAQSQGGAVGGFDRLPLGVRAAHAIVAYATYLVQIMWPAALAVFYPYGPAPSAILVAAASLLLIAITFVVIRRRASSPWLFVGWFWYLGMLVPVIGLVQVSDFARADRFTYLPLVGVFIATAWEVEGRLRPLSVSRWLAPAVGCVVVAVLSVVANRQINTWQSSETLWQRALEVVPDNYRAEVGLGDDLMEQGRWNDAAARYTTAIRLAPASVSAQNGLGLALTALNRLDEAAAAFDAAIRADPRDAPAHNNLGAVLARQGQIERAIEEYRTAIRLDPSYAIAHRNLGLALASAGRLEDAAREGLEGLRLDPSHPEWHYEVGVMLARLGRTAEAKAHMLETLRLDPTNRAAADALSALK
jgi:Flp pilus assembly protein TadD